MSAPNIGEGVGRGNVVIDEVLRHNTYGLLN